MQYLAAILGAFGLDQWIKNKIEKTKTEGSTEKALSGFLLVRKYHNRGAFLDLGNSRRKLMTVLSVIMTAILTALFCCTFGMAGKGLLKWGLTLMLGGAYSNTYDRLVRRYVVDYVSFPVPIKGLQRIVFNIGDFCIMVGAMLSAIGYGKG